MLSQSQILIRPLPNLVFGVDASLDLARHVAAEGRNRALVVTDAGLIASGVIAPALDALRAAGVALEIFDGVEANPTDRNVEDGAARLRALGEAAILAVGGGSAMDCGKAIALLAPNGERLEAIQRGAGLRPGAPVIAVATTAGTGSETNNACVITNTELGRKTYVMHPSITPRAAVLDPRLTIGLPRYPTATCGFDVLTHAVEAFTSLRATPYSDAVALQAIRMVAAHLRTAVETPGDMEARAQMMLASSMAAIAFNVAGLGSAHGTGHALSARLHAAHGQTLATMLPAVMAYNAPVCAEKYGQVAQALEPGAPATVEGALGAVERLRADIGIARTIRGLGATDDLLPVLVDDAVADFVNRSNPRPVDRAALEALYRAAW